MPSLNLEIELSDKQLEFEASLDRVDVTGYGGAKGGGKSFSGRMIPIIRCLERPGHVGALFRRSYPEIEDNHLGPMFRTFPELRDFYNSQTHSLRFPSVESEFKFRHCENMKDVERQAGREYHTLIVEEAGDWAWDWILALIRNSNRSSVPGIKATTGLMFNWGGLGHGSLKRVFYDKKLRENEKELSFNFILAKIEDNPKLMENDPAYLRKLNAEPNPALRRAHRDGDPNIVAGQFFTEFSRETHVVKPFKIPAHWRWFGSYDYGFGHPCVWHFWACDEDGNVYLVKEIYEAGLFIDHQADRVTRLSNELGIPIPVFEAGHDCWTTKKAGDPTIAEDFIEHGIVLHRANIARALGAKQVREYMHHEIRDVKLPDGKLAKKRVGPRVFVFDTCEHTINCLQRMEHDPADLEDVKKVDSSKGDPETGDDGYDCFRYGLMSRPPIANKIEKPTLDRYKKKLSPTIDWKLA